MKKILFIQLILLSAGVFAADLPDPILTPGAANPSVTQDNIHKTICVSGWTSTIRPSVSYTNRLKKQQMAAMHLPGKMSDYEEDHLISLELGGSPADPKNLWPQPWTGQWNAHKKDVVETELNKQVCSGKLTLAEAQHMISTNWITAYTQLTKPSK